jgi:hypothetical protein
MKKALFFILLFFAALSLFPQNHKPTAVDDYYETFRGSVLLNVLANDYDVDGDSIYVFQYKNPHHGYISYSTQGRVYNANSIFNGGMDTIKYLLRDKGTPAMMDTGIVVLKVDKPLSLDSVDVNNINAGVKADGFLFCDKEELIPNSNYYLQKIEYPKGSNIYPFYCGDVWVGGIDESDSLHVAADLYTSYGKDFCAGPVSSVYDHAYDVKYKRLWKVTKQDIDYHIAHYRDPHYTPAQNIADWPGNGDISLGETAIMAPFFDNDGNGIYNPFKGDYPLIKGDKTVLFIFNDDRYIHGETNGNKLGIEIRGMLYAFNCPEDSALWNSIFLHFDITNRSEKTYHNTYVGVFFDNDLGYAMDDYIGCDVKRGSFYAYNGQNYDPSAQGYKGYGYFPPAESVTFLGGPYIDADGLDNPAGNCDAGMNGLNFGNGIVDDERYGLSFSGMFWGSGGPLNAITFPETASDYYNYLHGYWKDSVQKTYWGNGHPLAGGTGPVCRYLYPGTSDPCHYGTWGVDPGGTEPWTEEQAGNPYYDRRSHGSSGPFTFHPGDVEPLDIAIIFGRNFLDSNAKAAIPVMNQRIDSIRSYFIKDKTPCGESFSAYKPSLDNQGFLYIYPNPTLNSITIEFSQGSLSNYTIFDMLGNLLKKGILQDSRSQLIDFSDFRNGVYFIRAEGNAGTVIKKIVKL